jgi:hypothetical protein
MVGLDGYMLIRFLGICFRVSLFLSFFGLLILVPCYAYAPGGPYQDWNKYTLANIPNDPNASQLWAPVIFAYVLSAYFCVLIHAEYNNFVSYYK